MGTKRKLIGKNLHNRVQRSNLLLKTFTIFFLNISLIWHGTKINNQKIFRKRHFCFRRYTLSAMTQLTVITGAIEAHYHNEPTFLTRADLRKSFGRSMQKAILPHGGFTPLYPTNKNVKSNLDTSGEMVQTVNWIVD